MGILSWMISPVKAVAKETLPEAVAETAVKAAKAEGRATSLLNTARV